jgi:hypothetical protein
MLLGRADRNTRSRRILLALDAERRSDRLLRSRRGGPERTRVALAGGFGDVELNGRQRRRRLRELRLANRIVAAPGVRH